ncbi:hypothetical protein ACFL1B_01325 [Nanoarchaeota archaeon]
MENIEINGLSLEPAGRYGFIAEDTRYEGTFEGPSPEGLAFNNVNIMLPGAWSLGDQYHTVPVGNGTFPQDSITDIVLK